MIYDSVEESERRELLENNETEDREIRENDKWKKEIITKLKEEIMKWRKLIRKIEKRNWCKLKRITILKSNEIVKRWVKLERILINENEHMIHECVNELISSISQYSFERLSIERGIDFYSPFKTNSIITRMGEKYILELLKIKNVTTRFIKMNAKKLEKETLLIQFEEYLFDIKNMNTYHEENDLNHIEFIEKTMEDIEKKVNVMKNNLKVKTIDLIEIEEIMKQIEVTKNHLIITKKNIREKR